MENRVYSSSHEQLETVRDWSNSHLNLEKAVKAFGQLGIIGLKGVLLTRAEVNINPILLFERDLVAMRIGVLFHGFL